MELWGEFKDLQEGKTRTRSWKGTARGSINFDEVYAYVLTAIGGPLIPAAVGDLYPEDLRIAHKAADYWDVSLSYSPLLFEAGGGGDLQGDAGTQEIELDIAFSTQGGNAQIIRSFNQTTYGRAPDTGGLINATKEGVEGVDVHRPAFEWSKKVNVPSSIVTLDYQRLLFSLTSTVNADQFGIFAPGEALYLGASAKQSKATSWDIEHKFAGSPNITFNLTMNETPYEIFKAGWDYIWFSTSVKEDEATGIPKRVPVGAYVEQVYPRSIFAALGL